MNAKFFPALGWVLVATFTLRGVSMLPAIHDGDQVVVEPAAAADLKPGQIVVYRNFFFRVPSLCHRLVEQKSRGWVTKGDNNKSRDPGLCSDKNLLGVVVEILPAADKHTPVEMKGHAP